VRREGNVLVNQEVRVGHVASVPANAARAGAPSGGILALDPGMSTSPADVTIAVTVTLFADLRRFLPRGVDGPLRYTLPRGSTVADLLATIGIAPDADVTVALDGELADREARLGDGADVMLLSPMEGG
jgi:sulfur carrier protein ThiS